MSARSPWGPHQGAVSLTFDDGEACQREKAIPLMDERGIKGTFYLCTYGNDWRERLAPWIEVGRAGHEIGNHSCRHVCSRNFFDGTYGLEDMTLEEVEADMLLAQQRLEQIAPHQGDWTFCYPCYSNDAGIGRQRASYVPLVAKHFLAGRGGQLDERGIANDPNTVDLAFVSGLPVLRASGFELIGRIEEAVVCGQWVVLAFHEIDGARLTVGSYDFAMLLGYLAREASRIWTAPFGEIAARVAAHQADARVERLDKDRTGGGGNAS
jgi:hypothetical protein